MIKRKTNAVLFLAIIFTLSVLFWVLPKKSYSDNENRFLTPMPEFSLEALYDGSFTRDFEKFVTDAFPFRDKWISLKSRLDMLIGRGDTGGVFITDDGSIIEMFTDIDRERYEKNLDYLRKAQEMYSDLDSFNIMLVPTAAEVWSDKIGRFTPNESQKELLDEASDLITVDSLSVLSEHKDEYIYYRNDHHWTGLGAYYCYQALMGDEALPLESFKKEVLSTDFLGTTFSKAGIYIEKDEIDGYSSVPLTVEHNMDGIKHDSLYDRSYLEKKDKYSVFMGGNQAVSVIKTDNENGKKLLLVKDSYANSFVEFLVPHYSEIHVIDLRNFGMSLSAYAEQEGITDMLVLYNLKGFTGEKSVHRIGG